MDPESWYDYFSSAALFGTDALKPTNNIKATLRKLKLKFAKNYHPNKGGNVEDAQIFFGHLAAAQADNYTYTPRAPPPYQPPPFQLLPLDLLRQYMHAGWVYAHPSMAQVRWVPPHFTAEAIREISKRVYERLRVPLHSDAERHVLQAYPAVLRAIDAWRRAEPSATIRKQMHAGDFILQCMLADLYFRSLYRRERGIHASTLRRHPGDVSQFYNQQLGAELWDLVGI
jgi:hypothetical protein